jgi:hypothetical protein
MRLVDGIYGVNGFKSDGASQPGGDIKIAKERVKRLVVRFCNRVKTGQETSFISKDMTLGKSTQVSERKFLPKKILDMGSRLTLICGDSRLDFTFLFQ